MKKILFLIALCSSINVACNTQLKINDTKIDDFVGKWSYSTKNETLSLDFELTENGDIVGKYCNVAYNGNRIDCSPDDKKNITGIFKTDTLYLKFTGFYDENAHGEAKLYKENDSSIVWVLGKCTGDFYLPKEVKLKRNSLNKEDRMDCNEKLSLLITSSSNYVTDQDRNELMAVIDRYDRNEYYLRLYNKSTTKDISLIKLNIENKTLIDYTDKYNEKVLEYEEVFYNSAISCLGLKIALPKEKEDDKLIEKFELYYQKAPIYQIPDGKAEDEDGGEIETMEISLDMCSFFGVAATNLWLKKIQTNDTTKICLLTTKNAQDNYITLLYTLNNSNRIIDKLLIGGNLMEKGVIKEYCIDDKNAIYTDKTDGQRVFDKKKYCINSAGRFEEIEE